MCHAVVVKRVHRGAIVQTAEEAAVAWKNHRVVAVPVITFEWGR